jgi:methylenetetrahydrofolate reductase (NADPH)
LFNLVFWAMRLLHRLVFIEGTRGYRMMQRLSRFAEKRPFWYRLFSFLELAVKRMLFDCRQCDDCALFELYYLCPESQCPKGQRIGPCGGSRIDGRCEVFQEKYCIWEIVYWRARNRRELDKLRYLIPPRNWKLYETSSWVNYFLKYDHSGVKIELPSSLS